MLDRVSSSPSVSNRLVAAMSFSTGAVVANLYYAQPLENTLATVFHTSTGAIGLLITLTQLGYAAGLATLVPLGDLVERRRLLTVLLACCVAGLVAMAAAPALPVILVAAVVVGVTSVAVQIIVPFAAHLAAPHEQGRVVGTVMSGLLIGILISRTVAGLLGGLVGWRWVFGIAAVVTASVAVMLWHELPVHAPTVRMSYPALLGSVVRMVREEAPLRYRMAYGACGMAAFSVFWSTAGFLLARAPYHWNDIEIGLFALLGVAGALSARFAGKLADAGHVVPATVGFAALVALSFVPLAVGGHHVVALAIGVMLLDLGVQGLQISNQSVIYKLRPDGRSRVNTAYMTVYFIGGTLGSALAALVYGRFGWSGVCVLGACFPVLACLLWVVERFQARGAARRARAGSSSALVSARE
jgi:predicted MFS family arabinose efflux permease